MKKLLLGAIAALTCAACVLGLASCGSGPADSASSAAPAADDPVVVGTLATEDILPFWAAEADGALDGRLQVQVFQSATELIAAITAGETIFSDAISSMFRSCRTFSRRMASATSGSNARMNSMFSRTISFFCSLLSKT